MSAPSSKHSRPIDLPLRPVPGTCTPPFYRPKRTAFGGPTSSNGSRPSHDLPVKSRSGKFRNRRRTERRQSGRMAADGSSPAMAAQRSRAMEQPEGGHAEEASLDRTQGRCPSTKLWGFGCTGVRGQVPSLGRLHHLLKLAASRGETGPILSPPNSEFAPLGVSWPLS
jgi:hypothetical protein